MEGSGIRGVTDREEGPIKTLKDQKTGHSISMKARRLRWAGHAARSNPSGSVYATIDVSIEFKRPHGRPKSRCID
ncbi:unnamed protein product [Nezara viridula]|uniref:Uncharacterized protein n=1 Tax=Nezara viridula TaxID=85310 RepID=A0A9P0MP11_NEZVI|nr:unnamed protein product [Nezara viridula]